MKSKIIFTLIVSVIVVLSATGCGHSNSNSNNQNTESTYSESTEEITVVLNERQKELLRNEGLPEEYDQLTDSQKDGIIQIEKVLSYLEEKYNDKFEYIGYVPGGLDGKYVTVKILGYEPEKIVTVNISIEDGKYVYSDDYEAKVAEETYVSEARAFLSDYFNPEDFKIYISIKKIKDTGNSVVGRASGVPVIFVNNKYSEAEVETAARAYADWVINENGSNGCSADFRIMDSDKYSEINDYNYKDYLGKEIVWISVDAGPNGNVEIKRYE